MPGSHLLVATGRAPATAGLHRRAGVELDARGYVRTDDELRTDDTAYSLALGDVNGRGAFTHTSYDDFHIVAENLLGGGQRRQGTHPIDALTSTHLLGAAG